MYIFLARKTNIHSITKLLLLKVWQQFTQIWKIAFVELDLDLRSAANLLEVNIIMFIFIKDCFSS